MNVYIYMQKYINELYLCMSLYTSNSWYLHNHNIAHEKSWYQTGICLIEGIVEWTEIKIKMGMGLNIIRKSDSKNEYENIKRKINQHLPVRIGRF